MRRATPLSPGMRACPCASPETNIFGTQVVLFENFDEDAAAAIDRWDMQERLAGKAGITGWSGKTGSCSPFPGAASRSPI